MQPGMAGEPFLTTSTNTTNDAMPLALTYRLSNDFRSWPSWDYPSLYNVYCVNYSIPGERNYGIGTFYIAQYLFYLVLYIPSLIVISRPPFIEQSCYKLMFAVGVLDNFIGFFMTFLAGVFSIIGANYCDNNRLLIIVGHLSHALWFCYCMTGVFLALNRYIEIRASALAERLYGGDKCWLWMIPPVIYGLILSTSIDLPVIYNSVWSVYLFQIDLRENAQPVTNWVCVVNSVWVMIALTTLYTLLIYELRKRSTIHLIAPTSANSQAAGQAQRKHISKMQKKALFQAFLICFFLFVVVASYAAAGFVSLPLPLTKFATIAIQLLSGFTSIVYLAFNDSIRAGVKKLLLGRANGAISGVNMRTHVTVR